VNNVIALPTRSLQITLNISDAEVIQELERHAEGAVREAFSGHALRLGVLALRQASGSLDADAIRRQADELIASVGKALQERTSDMSSALTKTVLQYLDPTSGALPQRIEQLTKPNGDLETLLAKHLHGDQSMIARTLATHIGEQSPIFKLLSPKQSDGLLAALTETLNKALDGQRDEVLKQFSLDRKESALSRLVIELKNSNGKLRGEVSEEVDKLVKEFSLDHEGSALQRLSALLTKTNAAVETSLTLDDEASPLARLKREILDVLAQHQTANGQFQSEVRSTLETFKTRREEAARSALHGIAFEDQLGEVLAHQAQRVGDVCERVALLQGRQGKVGDYVLELGPDSAAPGARVVYEAKANKSYTIPNALKELAEARKNRAAQVGVLVFDRSSAPKDMEPLCRFGNDVLVAWDPEEPASDIYLNVAFGLARTLAHRELLANSATESDARKLDALVDEIAAHVKVLASIEKAASSVKKNGETILSNAQNMREALELQVAALRTNVAALRSA
jgi:hypothetical protein